MTFVKRLAAIFFAFLAACLAAGMILVIPEIFSDFSDLNLGNGPIEQRALNLVPWIGVSMIFISVVTLLPAMIVVAITETCKMRGALTYAVAGALLGFVCYLLLMPLISGTLPFSGQNTAVITSAGIAAGLVCWMIAGRKAGAWRERPPLPSQSRPTA
jgi:phosphotransferase system  glucose/maltose/N-acetylglucosamine-specific IIC component